MNMRIKSAFVAAGLTMTVCLGGLNVSAETMADFRLDFKGTNNPHADTQGNGLWHYYRSSTINPSDPGANLTAYVWNETNAEFKDTSAAYGQVRSTNVHPALGNYVVARWESGTTQKFVINGFFQRNPGNSDGDGVDVYVYAKGVRLYSNSVPATAGYPKVEFSCVANLAAGECVDFVVHGKTTISSDRTDFDVKIVGLAPKITNWSFEQPVCGASGGTNLVNWSRETGAYDSPGIQVDSKLGSPPAPDGDQWCFFNLVANLSGTGGNDGSIWQSIGSVLDRQTYTVEFTLGTRYAPDAISCDVSLWAGGSAPSVAQGATLIRKMSVTPPPASNTNTQNYRATFTTGTGLNYSKLWLRFDTAVPAGAGGGLNQLLLDAISVEMCAGGTIILFN